jgi:EAL domain-containing protein (putative c-di-GMP-specific phosphodiesterase class I)
MAHSLKLNVGAEGVETEEQLAFLRDHGCHAMQGFLYSKPLPAAEVAQFILEKLAA